MKPVSELTDVEIDRLSVLIDDIKLASALESKSNEELARLILEVNNFRIGSPQFAILMEAVNRLAPELEEEDVN